MSVFINQTFAEVCKGRYSQNTPLGIFLGNTPCLAKPDPPIRGKFLGFLGIFPEMFGFFGKISGIFRNVVSFVQVINLL